MGREGRGLEEGGRDESGELNEGERRGELEGGWGEKEEDWKRKEERNQGN